MYNGGIGDKMAGSPIPSDLSFELSIDEFPQLQEAKRGLNHDFVLLIVTLPRRDGRNRCMGFRNLKTTLCENENGVNYTSLLIRKLVQID